MKISGNKAFNILNPLLLRMLRFNYRVWRRYNRACNPRYWSNDELRKFAPLMTGDVINVSGGMDEDKEGETYRMYFKNATTYSISNYEEMPFDLGHRDRIQLDLGTPIPPDSQLIAAYDVVFNHTVLEHVYRLKTAVMNLCRITKDIIVTVVPFIQSFHHKEGVFDDYWRFSPYALVRLFGEEKLETIYINWNNDPLGNIYIFHIASKSPAQWKSKITLPADLVGDSGPGYYHQLLLSHVDFSVEKPKGKIGDSLFQTGNNDREPSAFS